MNTSQHPLPCRSVGERCRFLAVLISLAITCFALSAGECYDEKSSWHESTGYVGLTGGETPPFQARIRANRKDCLPGIGVQRELACEGEPAEPGAKVTFIWTPPPGADVHFIPGSEPDSGGPPPAPYKWYDRDPSTKLELRFEMSGSAGKTVADSLQVQDPSGAQSSAVFWTNIGGTSAASPLPAALAGDAVAPLDTVPLWSYQFVMRSQGITLTQSVCEWWTALVQSDSAFAALRVPISPTAAITESSPLPLVINGPGEPYVQLVKNWTPIVKIPLELRMERLTFLADALPSAPGEAWIALGGVPLTATCPSDLNTRTWGFDVWARLDLSFLPDRGVDHVLPLYYCYEGYELPPLLVTLLGGNQVAYQGEGITCLGPQTLPLHSWAVEPQDWWLSETAAETITPTESIHFRHPIFVGDAAPLTATITATSGLGVDWDLYSASWGSPAISVPLTTTTVFTTSRILYFVSDPVPVGTAHGDYNLVITATNVLSPTDVRWAGDIIWVGDWVAPPGPVVWRRQYLPLILKNF